MTNLGKGLNGAKVYSGSRANGIIIHLEETVKAGSLGDFFVNTAPYGTVFAVNFQDYNSEYVDVVNAITQSIKQIIVDERLAA